MLLLSELPGYAMLVLLLAGCYLSGAALFSNRHRPEFGHAIIFFTCGLCILTFSFLLAKITGAAPMIWAALAAIIAGSWATRRPLMLLSPPPANKLTLLALSVSILSTLPTMIMGLQMGSGEFPAVFFAADTPYFLQQVHALIRHEQFPPPSLEVFGFAMSYHYGLQAFVAFASMTTGLEPHFLMFTIMMPLLELITAVLVYDICRRIAGKPLPALICLVIFLFGTKQYLFNYFQPGVWDFVSRVENFSFRYPSPTNTAGLLMMLCILRSLIEPDHKPLRYAAITLIALMPLFKLPYVVPAGAGLMLVYAYRIRQQFRVNLIVELALAGGLAIACYAVFFRTATGAPPLIALGIPGFMDITRTYQNETLAIFSAVIIATFITNKISKYQPIPDLKIVFLYTVAPFLLFSVFSYRTLNDFQMFDPALKLGALLAATCLVTCCFRENTGTAQKVFGWAAIVILALPGLASSVHHSFIVTWHPEMGHEFADNRSVADALKHIPVEKTLTVTNDLRYPANNFRRNNRQFQLAGIFGHQNFSSNLVYGGDVMPQRAFFAALVQIFQQDTWPHNDIVEFKKRFPITHLVIHKRYAHAKHIPLELVYSNTDYAVYRF